MAPLGTAHSASVGEPIRIGLVPTLSRPRNISAFSNTAHVSEP